MSFKYKELGECIKLIIDNRGKTPKKMGGNWINEGVRTISAKNVHGGKLDNIDSIRCVSQEVYKKWMKEDIKRGDCLLASEGATLGENLYWNSDEKVVIGQRLYCIRTNNSVLNSKYFAAYMNTREYQKEIEGRATGTSVLGIKQTELLKTKVLIRDIEEQRFIGNLYFEINEKIETNNQINKKLEEMAQAIFKQWFVDFEFPCLPENYKFLRAGKPCNLDDYDKVLTYKRVGGLPIPDGKSWFVYVLLCDDGSFYKGMTNDLYRRFYEHYTGNGAEWTKVHKPIKVIHYETFDNQQDARKREEELKSGIGREWLKTEYKKYKEGLPAHQTRLMMAGEMVESEIGMIPKGWIVKQLKEYIKFIKGKKPKIISETVFENSEVYLTIDALNRNSVQYATKDKVVLATQMDILMVMDGASSGALYYGMNGIVGSTLAKVQVDSELINSDILYFFLKNNEDNIKMHLTGSAIPHTDKEYINRLYIAIPRDKGMLTNVIKVLSDIRMKIIVNDESNNTLKNIRDTLLPKLMSGEIRVPLNSDEN